MRVVLMLSVLCAGPAQAMELDCVARLACVSNLEVGETECQKTSIAHGLTVGRDTGDKVIVSTPEGAQFYEFRRLPEREGLRVQATGGGLEDGQGAGALTVFDSLDFIVTRHSQVRLDPADDAVRTIAISIHGTCEETP
ncbi:hypothetical protein EV663_105130 [Rhodovulum bhavnagarense]|uniref:Uncharacterized protein n=1 Tax=Rhodovulum bhavnagarense TaxID=992286 RepID=A0A4R2RDA1_9RHOB|nr:hypothetical protein [Rhodovulum bhavnagarense]TCP61412.1 hypothetical protein EV663_105130 [Rhodovulum bhavnagarense]